MVGKPLSAQVSLPLARGWLSALWMLACLFVALSVQATLVQWSVLRFLEQACWWPLQASVKW